MTPKEQWERDRIYGKSTFVSEWWRSTTGDDVAEIEPNDTMKVVDVIEHLEEILNDYEVATNKALCLPKYLEVSNDGVNYVTRFVTGFRLGKWLSLPSTAKPENANIIDFRLIWDYIKL